MNSVMLSMYKAPTRVNPMTSRIPKFWHYFTAAMALDFVVILLVLRQVIGVVESLIVPLEIMLACWLFSNVLLYPKSNRRYVSYIHTYYRILKLYIVFSAIYWVALRVVYGSWIIEMNYVKFMVILLGSILVGKTLFILAIRIYRTSGYGASNFMIIGTNQREAVRFRRMLSKKDSGAYKFCCSIDSNHPYIESMDKDSFTTVLAENYVDEIYIYPNCSKSAFDFVSSVAKRSRVNVFLIPIDTTRHIEFYNFRLINTDSYEAIINGPLIQWLNRMAKRIFDILFSFLVIVFILSWLLPILGLLIVFESKGSVFFIQPRAGKDGIPFNCIKLRSMRKNAEAHSSQAKRKDPRITKVGAFIRSTSLDELPQFFNVLMGSMSIVGPRPHIAVLNEKYSPLIHDYDKRFLVKPGITGLAQAYGYRGETKGVAQMTQRVFTDIVYIQNWTFLLDIRIIIKTVRESILFTDSNAY